MRTITVSEVRAKLYRLIDQAEKLREPTKITGKRYSADLVSETDWSAAQGIIGIKWQEFHEPYRTHPIVD